MRFRDLPNEIISVMTLLSKHQEAAAVLATSLSEEHFADPRTKEIYCLVMALAKRRKRLPGYKTLQHDTRLSAEAKELMDDKTYPPCRTTGDAEQIIETLEKLRQGRVIISMYDATLEAMSPDNADPGEAFAIIEKGLLEARSFHAEAALRIGPEGNLHDSVDTLLNREKPNTIPTGFRDFDSEAGGLPRGGLTTLAASSGGGKSCMALQVCINTFWMGFSSAIITLEMQKDQMVGRLMSNVSGVNYRDVNLAKLNDMQKERIRKAERKMQNHTDTTDTRMDIFPMTDTTISEIALHLRAFDYDVIVIDYINLLNKEDTDQKNEAQALGEIARIAKNQAAATNAAWIMLAQLNEQGIVKYSRAIKEHSDYMLTWTYGDAEKESHIIEVDQQKSRNSESFKFNLKENFKIQKFENAGGGDRNTDVAIKKSKRKQRRLPTAAPMPGMNFDEDNEDEDL